MLNAIKRMSKTQYFRPNLIELTTAENFSQDFIGFKEICSNANEANFLQGNLFKKTIFRWDPGVNRSFSSTYKRAKS